MSNLTLGSLFDGSGGFPLAGMMAGITPIWASEIEPFPIRVTTKRIPHMKHYGDISKMNGGKIEPVDIITFGSPCQNLSLAGKREGLNGEKSSMFFEAIRVIKEMRENTNGEYPRWIVWENVPGAMSSSKGQKDSFASLRDSEVLRIEYSIGNGIIISHNFSCGCPFLLRHRNMYGFIFDFADFFKDCPKILSF